MTIQANSYFFSLAWVLRKFSGFKEHQDWLKTDLNAAKIIAVENCNCTKN